MGSFPGSVAPAITAVTEQLIISSYSEIMMHFHFLFHLFAKGSSILCTLHAFILKIIMKIV